MPDSPFSCRFARGGVPCRAMSLQRVWSGLVRACSFWICGSWSWLLLLCLELNADRPDATQLLSRALYVTQLACRYSALALVPLAVLHGLRQVALRKLQRPRSVADGTRDRTARAAVLSRG